MTPLHGVFPPPANFPEHPGSVGMQSCLHLLTKRCHELLKVLGEWSVKEGELGSFRYLWGERRWRETR